MSRSRRKKTIEEVRKAFEERGCTLLSQEYNGNKERLDYICKCGRKAQKSWNAFIRGELCFYCGQEKSTKKRRLDFDTVKQNIEKHGFVLLSGPEDYKNSTHSKLLYICHCGETHKSTYLNLKKGQGCKKCGYNKNRINEDELKEKFKEYGCKWINGEYKNWHYSKLVYLCPCGNKDEITASSLYSKVRTNLKCKKCRNYDIKIRFTKDNNPRYNHDLTDEERIKGRDYLEYAEWRKSVYKRDYYKCVCCNKKGRLNAHHLDSYSKNPYLRTVTSNGVTLCTDCHKEFHSIYGYRNNNAKQFREYMKKYHKKDFELKEQQLALL